MDVHIVLTDEFVRLLQQDYSPIDALAVILPHSEIVRKYRITTEITPSIVNSLKNELESQGLIALFEKYFLYSSGRPRTELPFLPRPLRETWDVINKTLLNISTYSDKITKYRRETDSDYFLLVDKFLFFTEIEASKYNLEGYARARNYDVIVIEDTGLIIDYRPDSHNYIYHRSTVPCFSRDDVNTAIITRKTESFAFSTVCERLTEIPKSESMWLSKALRNLQSDPDLTPEVVETLEGVGVSPDIISQYLIYASGRPRTNMKFIKSIETLPFSAFSEYRVLVGDSNPEENWIISPDLFGKHTKLGRCLIPVVRYQAGMSRGIYTQESAEQFCGTFYYFEPGSEYFLKCETTYISVNKMTAYVTLAIESGMSYQNAIKKPLEILTEVYSKYYGYEEIVQKTFKEMMIGEVEYEEDLYAAEDVLDQLLCDLAKSLGIEVLILSGMTGGERLVTEVLDTRTREDSFSHIYKKPTVRITAADYVI